MTISAPSLKGCCKYGEQKVLSKIKSASFDSVILEMASISVISKVGFTGVSIKQAAIFGCCSNAFFTALISVESQNIISIPNLSCR